MFDLGLNKEQDNEYQGLANVIVQMKTFDFRNTPEMNVNNIKPLSKLE